MLVTGATGYIGRHVLTALSRSGIAVVTAGRREAAGLRFIETDLLAEEDFGGLVRRAGATHLMHLAWEAGHGGYWTHPSNPRWALATARLVESFCHAGGEGAVVAGSAAEYDWSYGWCREDVTPADPATPYGRAKDAARRLCQIIARTAGVPLAWARVFHNYGPGEDPRRLVPSVAAALRGERPAFAVDASARRDFLHAEDVAEALVRLLTAGADGVANVSSGAPVRIGDVVAEIARALGADPGPLLSLAEERPGEPRLLAGDPGCLRALGWEPRHSLSAGLTLLVRSAA